MYNKFKLAFVLIVLLSILATGSALADMSLEKEKDLLFFKMEDPEGDNTGQIDLVRVKFIFSNTTGDYTMIWKATNENPFIGNFRVNLNLFNADTGTTAQNPSWFIDWRQSATWFNLTKRTKMVMVKGNNPRLLAWEAGDRVALSGPIPLGVPDGIPAFGASCVDLVFPYPRDSIGVGQYAVIQEMD
jgi:hypothetical protein